MGSNDEYKQRTQISLYCPFNYTETKFRRKEISPKKNFVPNFAETKFR
jgi:hypothetical protein